MRNRCFFYIFGLLAVISLTGCACRSPEDAPMTQLQIREIQSREFDTKDTKLVMKSMMNVLQDEGFIIKNAVLDLGLLSAEKDIDIENTSEAIMKTIFVGNHARWSKHRILEASANISEFGDKTRVRMNFQTKSIDNFGCQTSVEPVLDNQYYQIFFEKVSKGLFIQQENI